MRTAYAIWLGAERSIVSYTIVWHCMVRSGKKSGSVNALQRGIINRGARKGNQERMSRFQVLCVCDDRMGKSAE